ncbi:2-octaprenylphenol hydroxylase [Aquimixticola soesokkakensis]|uniref:2-octaprenylphenol hydroxylase n=1 Tax=Aquimixticola soesokkakensis TaxID=1519096 RepID=A0A1Y5SCX1_9RHOB|nr:FAD-dependent monooxygenase [Aquimixticola soesokkakensis]SLN35075.1 2-octaprenylphenol hydroxylase [Aquimixticola soesokkakensis]
MRDTPHQTDVLVVGGGLAGMIAAASFARSGFSTLMIDPQRPVTDGTQTGADFRSTAFLRPARALFERIGVWEALAPFATPLEGLRIVDTRAGALRGERQFEGRETADAPFGWNFLNWVMRRELSRVLPQIAGLSLRYGVGFRTIVTRSSQAVVTLDDGSRVVAKLVIAADGRESALRKAVGIDVKTTHYGQKSLAFTATHDRPHHNISTEIYREGGPFTMVPLADIDGSPASAIVWMNSGAVAQDLQNMAPVAFNARMSERAAHLYGDMRLASPRGLFPIITRTARDLAAERVALIAEAAHVLPPIGAQGLNTSLADVTLLLDLARAQPQNLGDSAMLADYARTRARDIGPRAQAIDVFNRVVRSEGALLQWVRLNGLKAVHDIPPLRRAIMQAGLGPARARK